MTAGIKLVRTSYRALRTYDWSRWHPRNLVYSKLIWPFRILLHPVKGCDEIKYERRGSVAVANAWMLLLFIVDSLRYTSLGFPFNLNQPEEYNAAMQFAVSVLLIILWCICNWATCTLLDGEGKFREIWIVSFYAMTPRLAIGLPLLALSHALVLEEQVFLVLFDALIIGWSIVLLLIGMATVHQFTFKRTVLSSMLTALAIAAVIFLVVLFTSMFQQLWSFVRSVSNELAARR